MTRLDVQDEQRRIQNLVEKLNTPNSNQLISRVQAFLPQLEASNASIAQADPKSLDIENIQGSQYIEMNLGLGVFQDRTSSSDEDMSSSSSSSDDDSDASSDSTDIVTSTFKLLRPTKPLPKRKQTRPLIEVLDQPPS